MTADEKEVLEITGTFRMNVIKRHLSQSSANQFKCTMPTGRFTNQQRIDYEKNGYWSMQKF